MCRMAFLVLFQCDPDGTYRTRKKFCKMDRVNEELDILQTLKITRDPAEGRTEPDLFNYVVIEISLFGHIASRLVDTSLSLLSLVTVKIWLRLCHQYHS